MPSNRKSLSIIVVGASGNLAKNKIFPALFSLFCQDFLPEHTHLFGFARRKLSDKQFRKQIREHLTCRYRPRESCAERVDEFLELCRYVSGQYQSSDSFLNLYRVMQSVEYSPATDRIFYLAIPPSVFLDAARGIAGAGFVQCGKTDYWSRVVVEKPFGNDRASSDSLISELGQVFTEDQTYRIDHYLGKEAVQNLMVLRFANTVFEPIWNRSYIDRICIDWKEDIGVEGRSGYFDAYGIIRDVVQNHLLQILALVAMEQPIGTAANHIQDEKVKVLRSITPPTLENTFLGQYDKGEYAGRQHVGYTEEDGIPPDSITPTFAATVLHVNNPRWAGVPFIVTAGKGLNEKISDVRIHFKRIPANIFRTGLEQQNLPENELAIRIQPDESIRMKIVNKKPALDFKLAESNLLLNYHSTFATEIPDAYERLMLDIMQGDRSLFIRSDELAAAWDVFTPLLHEIDSTSIQPVPYPFGSERPHDTKALLSGAGNEFPDSQIHQIPG